MKIAQDQKRNIQDQVQDPDRPACEMIDDDADATDAAGRDIERDQKKAIGQGGDEGT